MINYRVLNKKFNNIVEQAKVTSKERMSSFAKNLYNIDEEMLQHLWDVPIIDKNSVEEVFPENLITDDFLIDLEEAVEDQIGDSDAALISYEDITEYLIDNQLRDKYQNLVQSGTLNEKSDSFIAYDKIKLRQQYYETYFKALDKGIDEKVCDKLISDYISEVFIHERVHYNVDTLLENDKDGYAIVNGANKIIKDGSREDEEWENRNEVLVDTLAQMMNNYTEGDTIEDCLYKVIEKRKGQSSQYNEFDDKDVLSLFVMFPDELTNYAMLGAYGDEYSNTLKKLHEQVFGNGEDLTKDNVLAKAEEYFKSMESSNVSDDKLKRRKEMLQMLNDKTKSNEFKAELATQVYDESSIIDSTKNSDNKEIKEINSNKEER